MKRVFSFRRGYRRCRDQSPGEIGGLLADEGFEVANASNGYEALKIFDKESPDLVLLDIWMPGMDGVETLKEIKKDNPLIQVIIIT